jgi:hypothetical protein
LTRLADSDLQAADGFPWPLARQRIYGWVNEKVSASEEFLQGILRHVTESTGLILECASGHSSLFAIAARRSGQRVWSLENDPLWRSVGRSALRRFNIGTVDVCAAPPRNDGDFEWYDPTRQKLPTDFSFMCDRPPGLTPGGRYGLVPVLGQHVRSGCVILARRCVARWRAGDSGSSF